ncbi:hypothetical protein HWD03_gp098 [Alteromonas phage vB_AmeM_PT11-V22]|uniref:Uncharacterized protein n=1 Tax=Alteromonas phage vB_AmeM_PT11-V22 TaxID=2704031 RepID=A0A6C0R0M3_9CAUD|nr:hypothetical protein HWD03_gp098 [Alteromonas phage vB_AmeM_PT11-V22]QHZ59841.1 hypothetical protein [Alteromonas phage vB_AmeM_PT11-V22]
MITLLETEQSLTAHSYKLGNDGSENKPYFVELCKEGEMIEIDFFNDLEKALKWFNIRRVKLGVK